jgi:hypothetical protein
MVQNWFHASFSLASLILEPRLGAYFHPCSACLSHRFPRMVKQRSLCWQWLVRWGRTLTDPCLSFRHSYLSVTQWSRTSARRLSGCSLQIWPLLSEVHWRLCSLPVQLNCSTTALPSLEQKLPISLSHQKQLANCQFSYSYTSSQWKSTVFATLSRVPFSHSVFVWLCCQAVTLSGKGLPAHVLLTCFFFPPSTEVWTQCLVLARQAFYNLSHNYPPPHPVSPSSLPALLIQVFSLGWWELLFVLK